MASTTMQWSASFASGAFDPMTSAHTWEPARKRTKVNLACEECRRRKRKCSAVRPCFQCIEHSVACDDGVQITTAEPGLHAVNVSNVVCTNKGTRVRTHDTEVLTKQLQLCMETLEIHKERIHALSTRLQQLEQSVSTGHRGPDVAYISPLPHQEVEDYTYSNCDVQHRPTEDGIFLQAGLRSTNERAGQLEHPESSPAGLKIQGADFDSKSLAVTANLSSSHVHPVGVESNPQTVRLGGRLLHSLLRSYVRNMHILHPIIDLRYLESVWDRTFWESEQPQKKESVQDFTTVKSHCRKKKRKRADVLELGEETAFLAQHEARGRLETGLAYLVLALGAVCSEREAAHSVEDVASFGDNIRPTTKTEVSFGHTTSEAKDSPKPPSSGNNSQSDFLLDIGRQYYALAGKILSLESNGTDLIHAQLFVLAGLYEGQMGKDEDSMRWIRAAGQVAMKLLVSRNLLHPYESNACEDLHENYKRVQRLVKIPEHDFIVLAAWSCVQLEGDILARLPLFPSGIEALESRIPWPYRIPNSDAYASYLAKSEERSGMVTGHYILVFYTSQLWIRKWLKSAYAELGNQNSSGRTDEQLCDMLRENQSTLDCWRACLPEEIRWEDCDPPAHDILSANLRAAYWAAQYNISRVYLDHVLHVAPSNICNTTSSFWQAHLGSLPRPYLGPRLLEAVGSLTTFEIMQCSRRCIKSAVENVIAFDRIPHKLITANIQGIAHARFSCAIVLLATAMKEPDLVVTVNLFSLLKRTIAFLDQHSSESRQCIYDSSTLQRILAAPDFGKHNIR